MVQYVHAELGTRAPCNCQLSLPVETWFERRRVVCCHLHESGRAKGQAAAALTGAPATVEAADAEELLKAC